MKKISRITYWFFWFAFAAFLSASIPHVAFFFRAFEPQAGGLDMLWWIVSFAIAGSIDITIFLLSVTVANMQRARKPPALVASVWLFIIGLAALSFYINAKYAQHFTDTAMISPTALSLPWAGNIPDINPLIASMFQILAIAYTWIADKIIADEKPITARELKERADELELIAQEKKRIAQAKRELKEETGGLIGGIGSALKRAKLEAIALKNAGIEQGINGSNPIDKEQNNPVIIPANEQVKTDDTGQKDAAINPVITDEKPGDIEQFTSPLIALTPDLLPVLNAYPDISSWLSTSRKTVSYNDVANALNVSVKLVSNRVKDNTLKHAPRNDKLILITSVIAFAKTLLITSQNGHKTGSYPALKLVQNESIEQTIIDVLNEVNVS